MVHAQQLRRGATNAVSGDGSTSRKDLVVRTVVMKSVDLEVAKSYFLDDCPRMLGACLVLPNPNVEISLVSSRVLKGQFLILNQPNEVTVISKVVIKVRFI